MALAFLNRCVWRATSTGTGDFVVASAITGYKVPEDCAGPAVVDASTYFYFAESDDKTQWEIGHGVYTTVDDTLTRAVILDSTNAGAAVSFSAAPKVFMGGTLANDWPFSTAALNGAVDGDGIAITAGDGAAGNGGSLNLGSGSGAENGGEVNLVAGSGGTEGGTIQIQSGPGTVDNGGAFNAVSGTSVEANGGRIRFTGGSGGTGGVSGNGGSVEFFPGSGFENGGDVKIALPTGGTRQGLMLVTSMPTVDPAVADSIFSNSGLLTQSGSAATLTGLSVDGGATGGTATVIGSDGFANAGGGVVLTGGLGATDGGAVTLTSGAGTAGNGGAVAISPGAGAVDGGDVTLTLPAAGSGRQGLVIISNLPTLDPGVPGALWINGTVLEVSP